MIDDEETLFEPGAASYKSRSELDNELTPFEHRARAEQLFQEALAVYRPGDSDSSQELAKTAMALGKPHEAEMVLEQSVPNIYRLVELTQFAIGHDQPEIARSEADKAYAQAKPGKAFNGRDELVTAYGLLAETGDQAALERCFVISGYGTEHFDATAGVALAEMVARAGDFERAWQIADQSQQDEALRRVATLAAEQGELSIAREFTQTIRHAYYRALSQAAIAEETHSSEDYQAVRDDCDLIKPRQQTQREKFFHEDFNGRQENYAPMQVEVLCALFEAGDESAIHSAHDIAVTIKHRPARNRALLTIYRVAPMELAHRIIEETYDATPKNKLIRRLTGTSFQDDHELAPILEAAVERKDTMFAWNSLEEKGMTGAGMQLGTLTKIARGGHPTALEAALNAAGRVIRQEQQRARRNTGEYGWEERFSWSETQWIGDLVIAVGQQRSTEVAKILLEQLPIGSSRAKFLAKLARVELDKSQQN